MIKRALLSTALCIGFYSVTPPTAQAGIDPLLGEVMMVGYNFCPRGWAEANGQLLPISQNQALFSLYGTIYGGDGRTTFALPDLRGRTPIHAGKGPGLSNIQMGQKGGVEEIIPPSSGLTGVDAEEGERLASATRSTYIRSPFVAVRYCVATQGIFPSRN